MDSIKEATEKFESHFKSVTTREHTTEDKKISMVCSGGECGSSDPSPLLCVSEDLAISEWLRVASGYVNNGSTLVWLYKPEIIKFQITITDTKQRQRIANDRFTVKSKFVVEA